MSRTRILFVAEDVTLAQVVRLVTLARALDPKRYEVHFATSRFAELVFRGTSFVRHTLHTLSPERAQRALDKGSRLYERRTLRAYIDAELELYRRVDPQLVIGDFRLSLSTSAQLWGVPCAVMINAYWSPFAVREAFPVPDHPVIRWLGEARVEKHFAQALPHVFAHFAAPLNAERKRLGLPPVGSLLEMLVHGDYTLYPDERVAPSDVPPNVSVHGWVPGSEVARKAQLVISNGGSTTGYQALSQGTPVLGLPSNFDQHLASAAIERSGAGFTLKARDADAKQLSAAIERALADSSLRHNAARIAQRFLACDSRERFTDWIQSALTTRSSGL